MRKLFLLATLFFVASFSGIAQTNDDAWKYAQTITEQNLKDVLTIIASDQMEGRETGTEGQRRAAIYIKNEFKKIGLKAPAKLGDYEQKYLLFRDSVTSQNLTIGKDKLVAGTDFALVTGNQVSSVLNTNQVIFAGYGIDDEKYSDYKGRDVKGKIVLVLNGEPKSGDNYLISGTSRGSIWSFGANRKIDAAMKHGAVGVIVADFKMKELPRFVVNSARGGGFYFPRQEAGERIPAAYILPQFLNNIFTAAQVKQLSDAAEAQTTMEKVRIQAKKDILMSYSKKRFSVYASNVLGYIEGSDLKNEYVFVTAHYDHLGMRNGKIYYGADDDGSGTTAVIEMARALQKAKNDGKGPRRSVVFMTVSGEEKGLWGSEYYSENPVFPLDKTTVDLNIDMIGRIDPNRTIGDSTNYVYVIGNDKLSSDLDPIAKSVNDKYLKMELDFKFNDPNDPERIYFRSDHYNFARKGVPIIFYFDGIHKDYHQPSDTVDKINFDLMQKRTQYVFLTAWEIANRDNMLVRDIPLPEATR